MKIVADESVDKQVVDRLRAGGHKDFGDLVFRQRLLHSGVLLIRLAGLEPEVKAELVAMVFERHGEDLSTGFAVLSKRAHGARTGCVFATTLWLANSLGALFCTGLVRHLREHMDAPSGR